MFKVFNSERNRFETSKIKALLDVGDEILGRFYGFSPNAVEFLQNYDNSIRKGLQLTRDMKIKFQNALDPLIGSNQNASDDQKLFIRLLENL
ncbi:MAG: hypothetical protein ACTSVU_06530 [Promethearchaeota archaeon]